MSEQPQESFLNIDTTEVPESILMPEGDHEVRVNSVEVQPTKKDKKPMVCTVFEFLHEENADYVYDYMVLPHADMPARNHKFAMQALQSWKEALGFPQAGQINIQEAKDKTVWINVGQQEYQGRMTNTFNGFVKPASS